MSAPDYSQIQSHADEAAEKPWIHSTSFPLWARSNIRTLIARVRELEPRVLKGDWETVRDALDALPLGTVIKWSDDLGYSAAIKCPNVMGDARWFEAGVRNPRSSESIARDEIPIEVIA